VEMADTILRWYTYRWRVEAARSLILGREKELKL
jgi:hypothetical protein